MIRPMTMAELEKKYSDYATTSHEHELDFTNWLPTLGRNLRPAVPGELVVFMADTGHCKTCCIQNLAIKARPLKVLLFELELPGTLCFERFMAMQSGEAAYKVEQTYKGGGKVSGVDEIDHITVVDQAGLSVEDLHEIIMEYQPNVVMVDYIGLMQAKGRSRYEAVSEIAEGLKRLAKDTNTIVVATTQVHRKGDEYPDELYIHDAKESGSIENSAGVLIGVWKVIQDSGADKLAIKILKNTKGGGAGEIMYAAVDWPCLRIKEDVSNIAEFV